MASLLQKFLQQEEILYNTVLLYAHELNGVAKRFN